MKLNTVFSVAILLAALTIPASETSAKELLIELEPVWVKEDGAASDAWLQEMTPRRDGDPPAKVERLRIPVSAQSHPLFRNIFRVLIPDDQHFADWQNRLDATSGVLWVESSPIRYTCEIPHEDNTSGVSPPRLTHPRSDLSFAVSYSDLTAGSSPPRRDAPPNDPYFPLQWSLDKIDAVPAWDITRGDTSVVIAVVDVGTDISHGDLRTQRWINWAEMNGEDGVDDDGNGFTDDIHGWDFYDNDADPGPNNDDSHGSHVAGIVCAATDNSYGIAGVAWNCKLMAIRAGIGRSITNGYEGMIYAAASGADIINMSWGSSSASNIERISSEYAAEQGALIFAAAGNNRDSSYHYPGAYDQVVAVASTGAGDIFSREYSSFGSWVGLCAPGADILSLRPRGFKVESGTSMSTPIAAGAAALVKSLHPDWSPQQIMLQLTMSADPIDHINPDFAGLLGTGRLNLFRALSEEHSGFELTDTHFDDGVMGDGNGIIESAEHVGISVTIKNVLSQSADITALLVIPDRYVGVLDGNYNFGEVAPGEQVDNSTDPFIITVSRSTPGNHSVLCHLRLSTVDGVLQTIPIRLTANPTHNDHDNGQVVLTLSNFGALGYYDYATGEGIGSGFIYRPTGLSSLFHGSLMVAAPPDQVSDCAFGDAQNDRFDFHAVQSGMTITKDLDGVQSGVTTYEDGSAERPLDIVVTQNSYSYPNPPDDDYVILSYTIHNEASDKDSLYIGLYLDWDVIESSHNRCLWNAEERYGWTEHSSGSWQVFGAALLDGQASFHAAIDNRDIHFRNGSTWHDTTKMSFMLSGFEHANGGDDLDWSQLIGVGPYSVDRSDSVQVTFALLAGDDVDDLTANVRAARNMWNAAPAALIETVPNRLELLNSYPSPFNGSLMVNCRTDLPGVVNWSLTDLNGRSLSDHAISVNAGRFTIRLNDPSLPSGRYILTIKQNGRTASAPVTLLR